MRGMSTNARNQTRVPSGVPTGGQWAAGRRAEAETSSLTQDPRWSSGYQSGYQAALQEVQRTLGLLSPQQRQAPGQEPVQSEPDAVGATGQGGEVGEFGQPDSTDTTPVDQRDHTRRQEPYTAESLGYNDMFPAPVGAEDDAVSLHGHVFDTVESAGRVFHRRRAGIYPDAPSSIRLQADRPLGGQEVEQLRNLMGYQLYAKVAPKPTGRPEADTPFSFTFTVDTSEVDQAKMEAAFDEWERSLPTTFAEGTPARKTQGGTRKYEGVDPPPAFEVFYDRVVFDAQECADHLNGVRDRQLEAKQQAAGQQYPAAGAYGFQPAPPPMPPGPPPAG